MAAAVMFFAIGAAGLARADVKLASPFTSHMVLQREVPVTVWGTAEVGEQVTVEFAGQSVGATANAEGKWRLTLAPLVASNEGRTFVVRGSATAEPRKLEDVLVGEVWLASGQSNMDFTVAKTEKYYFCGVQNEAAEIAAANHPRIRMFTGDWARSYTPRDSVAGTWKVCTPENVREFSAVGYFFARELQRKLEVPVGIVTLTYGASCAHAWIRREAMLDEPDFRAVLEKFDAAVRAYVPPTEAELKEWETAVAAAKAEGKRGPRRPKPDPAQDQHNPTVMYNGMIAPVVPFAVRGFLWYQGESITEPRELFPRWNEALIRDWRKLWGAELPFYFCQLAAHGKASNSPGVREWQRDALRLPRTGMAVTIDVGDETDVHPKRKQEVGFRLACIALADAYGRDVEASGPVWISSAVEGAALRLKFSHVGGGLVAREGELRTFELAGADGRYVAASATIEGDTVVVRAPAVTAPVHARYAWAAFPAGCNFFNAAGFPAAPFRTDQPSLVQAGISPAASASTSAPKPGTGARP